MKLIEELKRRNVFRVGAGYVLLGWLIIQVTDTVSPALNLPEWTLGFVTWIGIIGLPIALFFAWAYELTPGGIKREADVDRQDSATDASGRKLDLALVVLLALTIGFIAWERVSDAPGDAVQGEVVAVEAEEAGGDQPDAESIAVLPLLNMSAETDNAFFAGGVHEDILTNLSRIDGLRVVSRTTVLRYVSSDLSLKDIGRELGVRYIVEGSVRRIRNHVRITVQLIDAVDDTHLWASSYDRELIDVFAVQSEVAGEITNALHLEIQPETVGSLDEMPTRSVKAYDLYLKAKSIGRSEIVSEPALQRQRDVLETAVMEDPEFVEAWGYLNDVLDEIARTIMQNNWFGETQAERDANFAEVRAAARRALDKAVALDPDNIQTLHALGSDFVAEQESVEYRTGRKQYIDRAIELNPDDAFSWYVLAWWHRIEGDVAAATPMFAKALQLDPLNARIVAGSLEHYRSIGDQEMTTELFERLAQIAPETGKDRAMAKVPLDARLGNLMALFGETADESVIETYAAELSDQGSAFRFPYQAQLFEMYLMQFENDIDGLLNLELDALPEDPEWEELLFYAVASDFRLAAQRLAGRPDDARALAQRILKANEMRSKWLLPDQQTIFDYVVIAARITLEGEDARRELRESMLKDDDSLARVPSTWALSPLGLLDADRVVQALLAQEAERGTSFGTDQVAMFHFWTRHLLVHPDMQAFYVEQGKWIDYLAARVPEYAQYAK